MNFVYEKLCEKGIKAFLDFPLAPCTSFKIGGNAEIFIEPENEEELIFVLKLLREKNIKSNIIGRGSNILFSDEGCSGAVIRLSGKFKDIKRDGDYIICGGAASLVSVCEFARQNALSGLEFAYGIPGSCGGAVYMNAGAYGGEMKDVVFSCEYIENFGKSELFADELNFSYRKSVFSSLENCVITKVTFKLKNGDKNEISSLMQDIMQRRKDKQPLEYPSAGSVFKRPEGYYAAALIDECGLKGRSVGAAQVSEKHAGFIINKGGATCRDVLSLIKEIQETVLREKGVMLECEIKEL